MANKDVRIPFELDGRRYEAVGFLNDGERPILGDEMLARTAGENGGAISEAGEDAFFFSEYRAQLPERLRRYYLVTGRRYPGLIPEGVSYFYWSIDSWHHGWGWLGGHEINDICLVVRRLP